MNSHFKSSFILRCSLETKKNSKFHSSFLVQSFILLTIGVLFVILTGCTYQIKRKDWSAYTGPGAEYFHKEELDPPYFSDPYEPYNRGVSAINHGFVIGIVTPIGTIYKLIVPSVVRKHIDMFAYNIAYPRRLFANLFQGKFDGAWDETQRFGINTSVGLLGFFDPAFSGHK